MIRKIATICLTKRHDFIKLAVESGNYHKHFETTNRNLHLAVKNILDMNLVSYNETRGGNRPLRYGITIGDTMPYLFSFNEYDVLDEVNILLEQTKIGG